MIGRVIEIQEDGRHLSLCRGFLSVSVDKKEIARIPLDEIAVLVANAYQLTYSHSLLIELNKRGIAFIACGNNHLPAAIFWPVDSNYHQVAVMKAQIEASEPISKQLWKLIIQAKIRGQQEVLEKANIKGAPLYEISNRVRSGDIGNLEAQAAKWYWPLLFGKKFTRNNNSGGINSFLNYGYAIIRSGVARAVMSAGMHPTFGIFHRNRLNPMCLVDDLMEPYRPIIDWNVYKLHKIGTKELNKEVKQKLATILLNDCIFNNKSTPISVAMLRTAQSLSLCFQNKTYRNLQLPDKLISFSEKYDS